MEERFVEVPENVTLEIQGDGVNGYTIKVSGPKGNNERFLKYRGIFIEKLDGKVRVYTEDRKSKVKAMVGTFAAHINNLIRGVTEGFEYRLRILYSHFPMKVRVEGKEVIIENFLGEKHPRKARIFGRAEVKVQGNEIIVTGVDKEECGQTAANIEQATKKKNLDIRVFQDGIYIVEKP
ncbi:50S ribosomal protein L6 [Geoglobus acetivorans]|uniref:Large ribosomal subunit protein uL6 n=1 Tax=Geoglobus acetivorans TaxID=565033 RepID=A0ABZ3GZG9_GEOAI|nr:50S ribosomal protein L6 [Geoglobus acetivorans]